MGAKRHTQERIDTGLVALAYHDDSLRASEVTGIPDRTLRAWRETHRDKLARIKEQLQPHFAQRWRSVSHLLTEIELRAAQNILNDIDSLDARDSAKVIQQVGVAAGIATDKSQLLLKQPTQITEHRDYIEIIRKLKGNGVVEVIDSTATELPAHQPTIAVSSAAVDSQPTRTD